MSTNETNKAEKKEKLFSKKNIRRYICWMLAFLLLLSVVFQVVFSM